MVFHAFMEGENVFPCGDCWGEGDIRGLNGNGKYNKD